MSQGSIDFDPFSDTFFDDPSATCARLRDEARVYRNDNDGLYGERRRVLQRPGRCSLARRRR